MIKRTAAIFYLLIVCTSANSFAAESREKPKHPGSKETEKPVQPKVEARTETYPDGKIKTRIEFVDGELNAVAREWFQSGKLHWQVPYRKGKRHGLLEVWYESGKIESSRDYVDGVPHGSFADFHSNGAAAAKGAYDKGEGWTPTGAPDPSQCQ